MARKNPGFANKKRFFVLIGWGKIACISAAILFVWLRQAVARFAEKKTCFETYRPFFVLLCRLKFNHLGAWREFWRCCLVLGNVVASQHGRMGRLAPSRWTFTPVMGRSRSRPVSKKSARRIPSASRARKGDGKRRDRLDGARGSDGGERVWWRDPETGGLSGVARRSLVAAAAQLAFAAVAVKSQRLYDVWRGAGWGESSWRSVTHGGGRDASLAQRWSAETRGWRERRDGGSSLGDW